MKIKVDVSQVFIGKKLVKLGLAEENKNVYCCIEKKKNLKLSKFEGFHVKKEETVSSLAHSTNSCLFYKFWSGWSSVYLL